MQQQPRLRPPLWAWFVLVGGGLFLVSALPGLLFMILISFFKANELSFVSIILMTIGLCTLIVTGWGMKRAYQAIRQAKRYESPSLLENEIPMEPAVKTKKPIWPWVVIVPGALLLIKAGPAAVMLPIMPLFLAGMSTDSGTTPDYVPLLIIVIGYGLITGYIILLVKAIKTLGRK